MPEQPTSEIAQAIQDVSERVSLLVREEMELAKAEMTEKVTTLAKGAVIGLVAGIFAVFGLISLLHGFAWLIWMLIGGTTDFYIGFMIVAVVLFILGGIGGFLASRLLRS